MARKKDAEKRLVILNAAKKLFAAKGFESTSMSMLAEEIGIPVGSVYTYFDSKEALLATIIDEGWGEFVRNLERGMAEAVRTAAARNPAMDANLIRLSFLIKVALPGLFRDLDLIAILFAQAGTTSRLEEKLNYLTSLVASIVLDYQKGQPGKASLEASTIKTGLAIMLLGSFETMRLIFHTDIDIRGEDVIAFLVSTVEGALGCSIPDFGDWGS